MKRTNVLVRITAFCIAFLLCFTAVTAYTLPPAQASAAGHTAQDGANWAKSQADAKRALDVDGNGAWCIDLIFAYYKYLGQKSPGGNAYNYKNNKLPAGWQRIVIAKGTKLQKGDVLVFKPGYRGVSSLGHVGIVTDPKNSKSFTSVEQHANGRDYCWTYTRDIDLIYCVIRPDFVVPFSDVTVTAFSRTYTGKDQNVADFLTLNYGGKFLTYGTDYTLSRTTVKNVGKYDITITGKGGYTGSVKKTVVVVPKTAGGLKLGSNRLFNRVNVSFNGVPGASYYIVEIAKNASFNNAYACRLKAGTTSMSFHSVEFGSKKETIRSGVKYYVRVRVVQTVNYNKTCVDLYSAWCAAKSIKY